MVKSRDSEASRTRTRTRAARKLADSFFHFTRSFISKSHRSDLMGRIATLVDEIADFLRDHAGFATAGPGKY